MDKRNLPNLIIIGAMKAGTTSLHYYLNLHPEISMSRQKELNFFVEEKNWYRGIEWYKSQFVGQAKIHGESSPNYTKYPVYSGVPQKMFSVIPETKLIYIVRNPIERIISHYMHSYAEKRENRSFEAALAELNHNLYVMRSQYFWQLEQYLELFSTSNILIITSEELLNFPQKTMESIFLFLGVETKIEFKLNLENIANALRMGKPIINSRFKFDKKMHLSSDKRRVKNALIIKQLSKFTQLLTPEVRYHVEKIYYPLSQKIERPIINESLRERLLEYLAEDISRLKEYTGCSFQEWNLE
ncbi:MAG: sulfotransferase [Cyanobacteria bacterium P01_A01_bin.40]